MAFSGREVLRDLRRDEFVDDDDDDDDEFSTIFGDEKLLQLVLTNPNHVLFSLL